MAAEHCSASPSVQFRLSCYKVLTIINRDGPVLVERLAPNTKIQNLHYGPAQNDIATDNLDRPALLQAHAKFILDISFLYEWSKTYVSL
jgi:hypothetical protein